MAPLSTPLVLLGLLGAGLLPLGAAAKEFNQEEELRNSDCDNGCFFGSFPGGSCTDDAACMCTQQKYRERYFCCMAKKCVPSVLSDSISRQTSECGARNMEFTFDLEAVCGVAMPASSSSSSSSSSAPATVTVATTTATPTATPTGSSSSSAAAAAASSPAPPAANGAPAERMVWGGAAAAAVGAAAAALLW